MFLVDVIIAYHDVFSTVFGALALFGLLLTYWNLKRSADQREVSTLLALQQRWNDIYATRNALRHLDLETPAMRALLAQDKTEEQSCKDILTSEVWLKIVRPVANFYEFVGLMVSDGHISAERLFVLVTVDDMSWSKARPFIERLGSYRRDLYVYWDELRRIRARVAPMTPGSVEPARVGVDHPSRWRRLVRAVERSVRI